MLVFHNGSFLAQVDPRRTLEIGFFVSIVRPRYHARTDPRHVARGYARARVKRRRTCGRSSVSAGAGLNACERERELDWQKDHGKIRPGFAGPSHDDVDKAPGIVRRSRVPLVL